MLKTQKEQIVAFAFCASKRKIFRYQRNTKLTLHFLVHLYETLLPSPHICVFGRLLVYHFIV